MTPIRAVIRNKQTGETVRWILDCYNQKATIRQLDKNLDYFPVGRNRFKHSGCEQKIATDANSKVIAEALIIDKVIDGVLFRGIHAATWSNDYVIWSDLKNPSIPQMLYEYIKIEYKHITKLNSNQFEVRIPAEYNAGISFKASGGKLSKISSVTVETLFERKKLYNFITVEKDSAEVNGRANLGNRWVPPTADDQTAVAPAPESTAKTVIEPVTPQNLRIKIIERGVHYSRGQNLVALVQNQDTYRVNLKVKSVGAGGGVTELTLTSPLDKLDFLRDKHQITSITSANFKKNRKRSHGLRIAFEIIDEPKAKTVTEKSNDVTKEIPVNLDAADTGRFQIETPNLSNTPKIESETVVAKTDMMNNIILENNSTEPGFVCVRCNDSKNREELQRILLEEGYIVQQLKTDTDYCVRGWKYCCI